MTDVEANPLAPLRFRRGRAMKNRFMLAPLTNQQSHPDGTLSDEEAHWLTMRAAGGFGAVMTAAAHVQANGQGFPGQLGVFDDRHVPRLAELARTIKATGALALTQLHHAGNRSPADLIGETPVSSSTGERGARALTTEDVHRLRDDFVAAAVRSERAGMDGTELHGAHGYILAQFLSPTVNHRTDRYGGSFENRARLLMEIIEGVRAACGDDFILGVRISPERFGIPLAEAVELAGTLLTDPRVDFLDVSLWDTFKTPNETTPNETAPDAGRLLAGYFADLPRHGVALGFAGKLYRPADVDRAMDLGADFVLLGRAAILMHDFPDRYRVDPSFTPVTPPVSRAYLAEEGLSEPFVEYMNGWEGFVAG
ncbi:MAG: NADH:flavin oxidoreductase [Acidimicrobiales bacterium]